MSNRINMTPARISTNLTIGRQTPDNSFGQKVKTGLENTANALASGASVLASAVPGGAVLSAAVSSMGNMTSSQGVGAAYSMGSAGVTALPGATTPMINTTLPGATSGAVPGALPGATTVGGLPSVQGAAPGLPGQSNMQTMADQMNSMLQLQMQMNQENQAFTTVSNVLKVRHDTVKNTISNVH